jgi:hypothetical protein
MRSSRTGLKRWVTLAILAIALVTIGVLSALHQGDLDPLVVEISARRPGDHVAKVRFRSLSKTEFVGVFVTEVFVGDRWTESAHQYPEHFYAMSAIPSPGVEYEIPVPKDGAQWRVRWYGEPDYAYVSPLRKAVTFVLWHRFAPEAWQRHGVTPRVEVVSETQNEEDF